MASGQEKPMTQAATPKAMTPHAAMGWRTVHRRRCAWMTSPSDLSTSKSRWNQSHSSWVATALWSETSS